MNEQGILLCITMPTAVVGVVIHRGMVTVAAPLVSYMKRWNEKRVHAYCKERGWDVYRYDTLTGKDMSELESFDEEFRKAVLHKSSQELHATKTTPSLGHQD